MRPTRVQVRIDEFAIEGFSHADAAGLVTAFERELRMLADRHEPATTRPTGRGRDSVYVAEHSAACELGAEAAREIWTRVS